MPSLAYERTPGAASRLLPATYRRHEPEKTVLYEAVAGHLETFLEEAREKSASGRGCPEFVERDFRRYLGCGILARGFARLRCPSCGSERLVAFSCKGRLCPSCWARRMADTAAHLVDRVLPEAPYRQWVLTFPWSLRLAIAMDKTLLAAMLRVHFRTLFAWQRRRGRALGIRGETGAVTFIQRFGGALNTNPHAHSIVPDGLFVIGENGRLTFVPLPPPSDEEVEELTQRLAARLGDLAQRRCAAAADMPLEDDDALLSAAVSEAQWVPRTGNLFDDFAVAEKKPLCAKVDGFTLHAARVVEAHDRDGLEKLIRYGLRAPFALDRFSLDPDGRVRYQLTKPWPTPEGKTELCFEPPALLRRLAALIPAPYSNLVRYNGVFANRSRYRALLPPPPAAKAAEPPPAAAPAPVPPPPLRPRRLGWAQLLRRVLDVDALTCAKCAVPMVVVAFLTDPKVVRRILEHLKLPSVPPPVAASWRSAAEELVIDQPVYAEIDPVWIDDETEDDPHAPRGPP